MRIGITGNIGSGKSTVCKIFSSLGIPVTYADPVARELMRSRLGLRAALIDLFGKQVYHVNGYLNKEVIARGIFSDQGLKSALESLVHPQVHSYLSHWFPDRENPYAIEEAALIFESGGDKFLDHVVVVSCPLDLRAKRVMARDGINRAEFLGRDANQWPEERKIGLADHVILNDGNHLLIPQVLKLHRTFIEQNKKK
jgi:dephospho-CoA kinase